MPRGDERSVSFCLTFEFIWFVYYLHSVNFMILFEIAINHLRAFSDDIMDASITRRCQPCWYCQPSVWMIAINDTFMLEAAIYYLISDPNPFISTSSTPTTSQTEMGQLIYLITASEDKVDLAKFSLERRCL